MPFGACQLKNYVPISRGVKAETAGWLYQGRPSPEMDISAKYGRQVEVQAQSSPHLEVKKCFIGFTE